MAGPWEDYSDTAVQDESGPWNDFKESDQEKQFRRDELAKEAFQARLEGEQAKALTGLTDIGTEAAKAVVRAASHVDPTGFTQGLMQQYGVEHAPQIVPTEVLMPDVETLSKFTREGLGNLGIQIPEFVSKPTERVAAGLVSALPEMAPALVTGAVLPKLGQPTTIPRLFQAQMYGGVPAAGYAAVTAETPEQMVEAAEQTALGFAFPAHIEGQLRRPQVIPPITGRQIEAQRGAIPPRGEPVAPIERVTPEQAAIAAERMSAPFEGKLPSEPSIVAPEKTEGGVNVFYDDAVKAYTASVFDERFGNMHGTGATPELAKASLQERLDAARKHGTWRSVEHPTEKPDVTPTVTEPAKFDTAITSSDPTIAYVSELGKPETTITVSAKTPAELTKTLADDYKLIETKKKGVYESFEKSTAREPAKPEITPTPKLSNKTIASIWNKLVETSRDDVTELLVNWQDARLSEDGTRIIGSVGREREVKTNPSKKSFLEWLNSDEPLNPKVYDLNPEWVSLVERTREKTGLQPKPTEKPTIEAKAEPEVGKPATLPSVGDTIEYTDPIHGPIQGTVTKLTKDPITGDMVPWMKKTDAGVEFPAAQWYDTGRIVKPAETPVEAVGSLPFTREEIQVGKPSTTRRTRPNGTDGEVSVEINAPSKVTDPSIWHTIEDTSKLRAVVQGRLEFSTGKPPKKTDAKWSVWGGSRNAPELIARDLTYSEAIERAKDHVESATKPIPETQPIPQGPGARTAQTIEAPESYSGTALKNATAEIERAGWGMAEAPEHVRQSIPEAWIRAGRSLERDPMAGQKLVDELQADPKGRGLSVDESALLLRQKVILKNEMNAAAEGIHTAKTPLDKARAEANYDWAHEKMLTMLDAIKNRGTVWGQEGRWRQVMAREDFSLATLVTQREAALGRKIKPGTPEFEELKKHADRLQELNSKLEQRVADVEKEFQDSEVRRALAEAQANANKELPYHPRILELAEGYAKKWDARGAKALAELKEMFGEGQAFSGAPISPAMLDRAIIYGTSKMVRGAVDLAKWTDAMVRDLGPGFAKYARDVFEASKRAFDQDVKTDFKKPEVAKKVTGALKGADLGTETILKQIAGKAAKAKEGRLPNINYYLRKLGRVYAREGIKEEGPFLDRMTADVQKVIPSLTRDDVRAIFGGYAEEVRALSKEPVEVILRDMRGQSRELHKLSLLKQKIIPPKLQERATPSDAERLIRKQVEAEKRTGGFAPPDPEVQLRSAMQSAETRLTNQITDLTREIETGEKIVKQQRAPLKSEKLDALRERRDRLREIHDEVFKKPDLTDAERLEIWKERVKEQIDELRDKRRRGDFQPKPKPDPIRFDKQAIELQFLKEVEHRSLMEMRAKDELSKRTTPEVIKDSLKNAAMFAHMAMAGGEFSAVFKQGATGAYSRPITTARNFAKSLKAWWSEENQFNIKHEILTRDNAPFYRRDKLEFTDVGGRLSSMEEMYMFRVMDWMKRVPGLSHYVRYMDRFQRAFSTFLNLMRADTYDAMVREMGSSPEAGQSAANYINVATGRGSHSTARFGGSGANAIFFAPRWSISRFQYLLGQPILAAKPGFKKYIVKQYAKTLVGLGSVYALGYAMGGDVDWNPTSSKFGKIQIGNRVIDPLFGLAPVMRIIAQQVTGLRKNYKGKVRPIREGGKLPIFESQIEGSRKLGPYDPSGAELMGKFAWSKLAPAPEATVSAAAGENVIGEKFNVGQKLGQLVTPITYRDVIGAIKDEGIDENTAIDLLAIFGLSSYIEKPRKSSTNF